MVSRPSLTLPLSGLKKMKRLSGRPQDLVDLERLEELE